MSRRRAGRSRLGQPRRRDLTPDTGVMVAWARDESDVEEAKQASHDALIVQMGARRIGGVSWRIARGADAERLLRLLEPVEAGDAGDKGLAETRRLFETHGGVLVVATYDRDEPDEDVSALREHLLSLNGDRTFWHLIATAGASTAPLRRLVDLAARVSGVPLVEAPIIRQTRTSHWVVQHQGWCPEGQSFPDRGACLVCGALVAEDGAEEVVTATVE